MRRQARHHAACRQPPGPTHNKRNAHEFIEKGMSVPQAAVVAEFLPALTQLFLHAAKPKPSAGEENNHE